MRYLASIAFVVALVSACAVGHRSDDEDGTRREPAAESEQRAITEWHFIVTRQDFRKCMWPMCGGVYVTRVNKNTAKCPGGGYSPECYVAQIDLSALGLDPEHASEINNAAVMGHVVLKGKLVNVPSEAGNVSTLVATSAWQAQALATPSGTFYEVEDSGIVCITYPCNSIEEQKLNTNTAAHSLAGVDLDASGAGPDQLAAGYSALAESSLLVAGTHQAVTGPGGTSQALVASEFYTLVAPKGEKCGTAVCGAGTYCCNASCNMCVPEGNFCIQIACEPQQSCAHSECSAGTKLDASCSSCADSVCAADSYCCNNEWDSICVAAAEQSCQTCTPPAPTCAHSECGTGVALESECSSCAKAVCGIDSYCCNNEWDSVCVDEAASMCGSCGN
ncbi:MAG TPA: DUF6748 domain-containing protein [Polyangiaceae bacterium]|nr:DUF6748 domain-containing protein [Polyangiaceae bacterium]